jgi:hypothetical protein
MSEEDVRRAGVAERVRRGEISQVEASEMLGLSYRQTKRLMKATEGEAPRGWYTGTQSGDRIMARRKRNDKRRWSWCGSTTVERQESGSGQPWRPSI